MPVRVEEIASAVDPAAPEMTVSALHGRFVANPALSAIPIVAEGIPIGLVHRQAIFEALAGMSGLAGLARQSASTLMQTRPVMAERGSTVGLIAMQASQAHAGAMAEGIILVDDGVYEGYISPLSFMNALARENGERAHAMRRASHQIKQVRAEASAAAEERSRFLAFLAHEIRTPLTGVLGVADLLHDSVQSSEPRRLAQTIADSGCHLDRLLGDLLDLSRLEAGKLSISPAPVDLREFAAEARSLWQSRISGKQLDLRIRVGETAPKRIAADATRLRQVMFNLMSNALKFTERGYVAVELSTHQDGGQARLEMTVSDTGCGISEPDKERLFEAFEQASASTATTHGGWGLGLSIAKGLVDEMGGQIALADNPGGGSVFTVTLPVEIAGPRLAAQSGASKKPRTHSLELGRILLAEDHPVSAMVVSRALLAAGWQIDCVNSGEEAVARVKLGGYQAVLTDIHMPEGDGFSVVEAVRAMSEVPVLAITADVSPERKARCLQAGFDGVIEKPIRPRALVATLADTLIAAESGRGTDERLRA